MNRPDLTTLLQYMFERALRKYMELKRSLPTRIFFYRDGVGEGQVSHVLEHEVMRLKDTAMKVKSDYNPKITFIIVSKRINTRYSYFLPLKHFLQHLYYLQVLHGHQA